MVFQIFILKGGKAMKKSKRITAAVLSMVMTAVLCSGSVLAAEADNLMDTNSESVAGIEDEIARLKRFNPQITDEQWARYEKFQNPEANGLLKVDETERVENGHCIVESYYIDAINPCNEGVKEYSASSSIYLDETQNDLIAKQYMWAVFDYNNDKFNLHVKVVEDSIDGFWIKETSDSVYPMEEGVSRKWDKPQYMFNFDYYADANYAVTLRLGLRDVQTYTTTITVKENGEMVTPRLQYQW